jgi:hypothetical protein
VAIWWMPTHVQAVTGQLAWVLLLVLTLSWAAARRERWVVAGAWLGVAVAIKPFLLPMLVWIAWRGQVRAALAGLGAGVTLALAGAGIFGVEQYRDWATAVGGIQWYARPLNASIWGAVYRTFTLNNRTSAVLDIGAGAAAFLSLAASAVVVLVTWLACRRLRDVDDQWSLVLCATLLITPLGWVYYGCLLLPGWRARWPGVLATLCWLVPTPWLTAGQPSPLATVAWGSAATWGLLLIWIRALRPS